MRSLPFHSILLSSFLVLSACEGVTAPPPLPVVDPLPQDPGFNDGYAGAGDQIVTTLTETFAPRFGYASYVAEDGNPRVTADEFGAMHAQPGEPHLLRDQLAITPVTWTAGALPSTARSAHFSFMMGDPQIVDQDSPSLVPGNQAAGLGTAFRPWGEMIAHLTDALIRVASAYHEVRPLDGIFVVGDMIENAQQNELEWFITLMDGGELSVDSGDRDDVISGPDNDAYDPFIAAGAPAVPWLSVIGNHDLLVNGNFPPGLVHAINNSPEAQTALAPTLNLLGLTIPGVGTASVHPGYLPPDDRPIFHINADSVDLRDIPYQANAFRDLEAQTIPADPARAFVDTCDIIAQHQASASSPSGHGFTTLLADCMTRQSANPTAPPAGWYTYDLNPAIRVIALSLGPAEGGASGVLARPPVGCMFDGDACYGNPESDQVAFLETELARAQTDEVAVIVLSHQSSGDLVTSPDLSAFSAVLGDDPTLNQIWSEWIPELNEPIAPETFRAMLSDSSVVIAHLAGHNHLHQVRAICPDGTFLEGTSDGRCAPGTESQTGYWEITSAGPVDFPHQARFVEFVHVSDGMGAIYLTVTDPRMAEGSLTERAKVIARAYQAARTTDNAGLGEPDDRNVLLPFALSSVLEAKWAQTSSFRDDIASETALTQPAGTAIQHPQWP